MATPFDAAGALDHSRLVEQARWCLAQGCASVTVFGTTGEGASIGLSARDGALAALRTSGIDLNSHVVGGVAASSQEDALDQMRQLLDAGVRAVLLAPPFYFKGVGEDGLFAWFTSLFDALGERLRDVILYNIPPVTAVAISPALLTRLREAYPAAILGVKDSSGSWESATAYLDAHRDIAVLIGDERRLAQAMKEGAQGAISGLANVMPERLAAMIARAAPDEIVSLVTDAVLALPVTPAIKALVADRTGDDGWRRVRPPLRELDGAEAARLREHVAVLTRTGTA